MATIDHQVTYGGTLALQQELGGALGWPSVQRTLETTYFDTADLSLYRAGATYRERRNAEGSRVTREAKVPVNAGLERSSGDEAQAAIQTLVHGEALEVTASQTKVRTLHFVGHKLLGIAAPEVVVALDKAVVTTPRGNSSRHEIEFQIFTKLPWTSSVSAERLSRFSALCQQYEADYQLVRSEASGYQAIVPELLK